MNYQRRLKQIQGEFQAHKIDSLLVTHLPNIRYLCGFTGSAAVLLLTEWGRFLFTDGRYTAQARSETQGARVVIARKNLLSAAAEFLANKVKSTRHVLGIEADHLTWANRDVLARSLPKRAQMRPAANLVERQRLIKDADELRQIREAVLAGSSLFKTLVRAAKPGVQEVEVAAEIEHAARRSGADGMAFETIIAGGKRSALPHGRASRQPLPRNGFVVCDFGVILAGYCSDMTRTLYMGRPSRDAQQFYGAVAEAQLAAIAAVSPGVAIGEVDRAARTVLKKAGLGRYFTHSTGHGVGLEIHEAPRVAAGQSELLRPGMVITIEPGAYIPDKWGVRIEDMVVVTDRGCEVLTPTSKELIAV